MATPIISAQTYRLSFQGVFLRSQTPFLVFISPPPYDLQVNVTIVKGRSHVLYVVTNQTQVISSLLLPPLSIIEVIPDGAEYNVTIMFKTDKPLILYYGAFTYSPASDYPNLKAWRTGDGYFVPFSPSITVPPGNFSISFYLVWLKQNTTSREDIFSMIPFPKIPGLAIFLLIFFASSYVEAFIIVNAYYKNKEEGLSFNSKVVVALTLVAYAFLLYWSYFKFVAT